MVGESATLDIFIFFFFQAEDGIRDYKVTGVQTCALPILRYLRRLYLDPMTNSADWQLVLAPEGGIKGVYSGSMRTPIKRANFAPVDALFADSDCYCAWQFVYEQRFRRRVAPGNPAPGSPSPGNLNGQ